MGDKVSQIVQIFVLNVWANCTKYILKSEITQISCKIEKSAKDPEGIFGFFYCTGWLHVFIQQEAFKIGFKAQKLK